MRNVIVVAMLSVGLVSIAFCAPLPTASMATTAATPIRMPSSESPVRTLLAASVLNPWWASASPFV